jgi:thioredoxin-related protein
VWLLSSCGGALADSSTRIPTTDDWSAEVAEARISGLPIIILFSSDHCHYCERLKVEVLEPLIKRGELRKVARIRELQIDRGGKIRDFDGEKVRTRAFVKRYGIYATPTLVRVNARGEPLGAPIVGFNNPDDYLPNLKSVIEILGADPQFAGSRAEATPPKDSGSS